MPQFLPTLHEWRDSFKGAAPPRESRKVEDLLSAYRFVASTASGQREQLLKGLIALAQDQLKGMGPSHPHHAAYTRLYTQTCKQLRVDGGGAASETRWTTARAIFGPRAGGPGAATRMIQHHGHNQDRPTSMGNYWLERLDPLHRSWGHMDETLFDRWVADTSSKLSFFDWLKDKGLAKDLPQVKYLAPEERRKYLVFFKDDRLMYRQADAKAPAGEIQLELLSTKTMQTHHDKEGYAIWVCSPDGDFYTNSHEVSRFHHSSFMAGERVLCGGGWVVSKGKLLLVNNRTGHYAATRENLYAALQVLARSTDLSETLVAVFSAESQAVYAASEFLENKGRTESCEKLDAALPDQAKRRCAQGLTWSDYLQRELVSAGEEVTPPSPPPGEDSDSGSLRSNYRSGQSFPFS